MPQSRAFPDFHFEKALWSKGLQFVAGADEVGRGAFAGPLVTAVVIFRPEIVRQQNCDIVINDSKRLTPRQRQLASDWIKKNSLWSLGQATVSEINELGMTKATHLAFRRAVAACRQIDYLLMDAFYIPYLRRLRKTRQMPIIKGDQKSLSIAAASIVAKVYRDAFMTRLAKNYQHYSWHLNKGYGTRAHCGAILNYGKTSHHRARFVETFARKYLD